MGFFSQFSFFTRSSNKIFQEIYFETSTGKGYKYHHWLTYLLVLIMTIYLALIPLNLGVGIYHTFITAAKGFFEGLNPYGRFPGNDYYKYGPFFLYFPMKFLLFIPEKIGGLVWQLSSVFLYCWGFLKILQRLKVKYKLFNKTKKQWFLFSILFPFVSLFDLNTNGIYLQSNSLMIGGWMLGLGFFLQKKYFLSGLLLAYFVNMKILPITFVFILFLSCNRKFFIYFFVGSLLFFAFPFGCLGFNSVVELYKSWFQVLSIDQKYSFGKNVHFYLSIRPFLESNFNYVWGDTYFYLPLIISILIGLFVRRDYLSLLKLKKIEWDKWYLVFLFSLSVTFTMLFNPRTEGPSLILLAPVYGLMFLGLNIQAKNNKKWINLILLSYFYFCFFLTSLSCSDLFSYTLIGKISWNYNLRFIGILLLFLIHFFALLNQKLYKKLYP